MSIFVISMVLWSLLFSSECAIPSSLFLWFLANIWHSLTIGASNSLSQRLSWRFREPSKGNLLGVSTTIFYRQQIGRFFTVDWANWKSLMIFPWATGWHPRYSSSLQAVNNNAIHSLMILFDLCDVDAMVYRNRSRERIFQDPKQRNKPLFSRKN